MKKIFTLLVATLLCSYSAEAWTGSIHAGIAAIAHDNLTEKTKERIAEILDGHTIVYIASVPAEDISTTVAITAKNKAYDIAKANKSKDADIKNAKLINEITNASIGIKDKEKNVATDALRKLITTIGELHNPAHYIFVDAKHYRDITLKKEWESTQIKFTEFWESEVFYNTYKWTTNEFVHQLSRKTPEQIDAITSGTYGNWVESNAVEYRKMYESLPSEIKLEKSIDYTLWKNKFYPYAIEQIAVAGYRLAEMLNDTFDR